MRYALTALGLCLLATAVYFAGGRAVLGAVSAIELPTLCGAAFAIIASTIVGARKLYDMTELRGTLGFGSFLRIFWRSWAIGITLPGQVADLFSTAWQLQRHRAQSMSFIAARLLADKIVTTLCMLAAALSIPYFIERTNFATLVTWVAAFSLASFTAWITARRLHRRLASVSRLRYLQIGLDAANTPPCLVLRNLMLSLLKMALTGVAYWLLLREASMESAGYLMTTAIAHGAGLVAYLPISFNGLGTVELAAIGLFTMAGLPEGAVLGTYLVLRVLTLSLAWLPTLFWTIAHHGIPAAHKETGIPSKDKD